MPEIVGVMVGSAVLVLLFRPFFGDASGFWSCVRYWFTPDIISLFRGEWGQDWMSEMALLFWLFCGGASGFAAYTGMIKLVG